MTTVEHMRVTGLNTLICPECDGQNLHQYEVAVFCRSEDDDDVLRTTIVNAPSPNMRRDMEEFPPRRLMVDFMKNRGSGNPSFRRHGTVIRFWCENCDCRPQLCIAQHKGEEEVEWRVSSPP